jgi:dolichyl-phosphate-mannose-protein mannosyltransferase
MKYGYGLLHSHPDKYPASYLGQQQVTTYGHKDGNNDWIVLPPSNLTMNLTEPVLIKSGDRVRLVHVNTQKTLVSQQFPAFIGLT